MVKSSTAFLAGAAVVGGGLLYLKHTQPTNQIFQYLSTTNPSTVQKLIQENSTLRHSTNQLLQKLAFQSPAVEQRERRYGAMPFQQSPDTLVRQRHYGSMPFEQSPDVLKRERRFGSMGFNPGQGTRSPDLYAAFGMADGVQGYSPFTHPTTRPGTIIQHPPPGTPTTSVNEFNKYSQQNRLMNSDERQRMFHQMSEPTRAEIFGMN